MKECREFVDPKSPKGIRVYQVSEDEKGAGLVYPDQPCFLRGGRRFIFNSSEGPKICGLDDGCATRKLFDDTKHRHASISFDGRYAYFAEHSDEGKKGVTLYRKDLESFRTEELYHADGKLPGTDLKASQFAPSTVSSDNRRVATTIFLGDGTQRDAPYGIVALDLEKGTACIAAEDRDFGNSHLQYCRSSDADASHDLLIQMNHGAHSDEQGRYVVGLGPPEEKGVDIHVVRDDGTNWRDLPFGRDGKESCIGHQLWRGLGRSAATVTLQNLDTTYGWGDGSRQEVVAGWPVKADKGKGHLGRLNPGSKRVVLSRGFRKGRFCHLAVATSGLRFVFDTFPIFDGKRAGMQVYIGSAKDEKSPLAFRYILNSRVTFNAANGYHAHPILSPDGSVLFFNSNLSGKRQVYMVTDFQYQ